MDPAKAPTFFLNLHTADPEASLQFFTAVGFTPVPEYSDAQTKTLRLPAPNDALCLMLHAHKRFKEFIRPGTETNDATKTTEALITLGVSKKELVDEAIEKAVKAGGSPDPFVMEGYGQGMGMYSRSFADLDGHIWEVAFMGVGHPPREDTEKKEGE
ncbi:hypothetical protein MFIFM68171_08129 [Madurella fahalii]|uniref:VOC domain-containing protein n=1 Tax=Madurella fahalii TaxID=1157608 RepID=A0ABQ0GJI0_9PEZI